MSINYHIVGLCEEILDDIHERVNAKDDEKHELKIKFDQLEDAIETLENELDTLKRDRCVVKSEIDRLTHEGAKMFMERTAVMKYKEKFSQED